MKNAILVWMWLSVSATIVGFFLPWARIDVRKATTPEHAMAKYMWNAASMQGQGRVTVKIHRGTETITGDLPSLSDIPKQVSGVQIPQVANQEQTRVAMALIGLFTQTPQHIGAKSYTVYLVPSIALLCGALLTLLSDRLFVTAGIAGCCAAIAGLGFWKLLTTNTQSPFVAITIGGGLWLSLWGYVGLAVAGVGLGALRRGRP